jgi:predicted ester cyclase
MGYICHNTYIRVKAYFKLFSSEDVDNGRALNDPSGNVRGKAALRAYFSKGLEAYPDLKFELKDVMWGLSSVVLYYTNQVGKKTGEFIEIDGNGKVVRVVANYSE